MKMKICCRCKRRRRRCNFGINRATKDGLNRSCKDCHRAYVADHYVRNKAYYCAKAVQNRIKRKRLLREIILEAKSVPCPDCGHTYPPICMDLDHVRGEKMIEVCILVASGASEKSLREELAKCEAVCANCHRIRTMKRGYYNPHNPSQPTFVNDV